MAFPVVEATNTSLSPGNTTSHVISLPAGIQVGERLLALISTDGNNTFTWPAGWTELFDHAHSGTEPSYSQAWRIADGSEGATITVTSTASETSCHTTYRISGAGSIEVGTVVEGNGGNCNAPNLAPSWGAGDTLWIASYGADSNNGAKTVPTNYGNQIFVQWTHGLAGCELCSCRRELAAAAENPPAWGGTAMAFKWLAQTTAIQSASVATPIPISPAFGFAPLTII